MRSDSNGIHRGNASTVTAQWLSRHDRCETQRKKNFNGEKAKRRPKKFVEFTWPSQTFAFLCTKLEEKSAHELIDCCFCRWFNQCQISTYGIIMLSWIWFIPQKRVESRDSNSRANGCLIINQLIPCWVGLLWKINSESRFAVMQIYSNKQFQSEAICNVITARVQ